MTGRAAPKVLIVAPNASARFGGEAFLPLHYFERLRARGVPALLLTHARNRDELALRLEAHAGAVFYVEDGPVQRAVWAVARRLPERLRDVLGNPLLALLGALAQRPIVRRLAAEGRVEVIHQPIPVSPRAPSALWGFGVPVVIGPMNGAMTWPPGYDDHPGAPARRFRALGQAAAVALNRLIPGKRRAAVLLVANARTRAGLPVAHPRIVEMPENGVDFDIWRAPAARARSGPFRLVFMGRLVALKGLDFALEALASARAGGRDIRLDILGDGEDRGRLEAIVRSLGLGPAVAFLGFRPQPACAEVLAGADALVMPSLFDCGGAVVLEAMAMGLPVIASDWGGPADYVTPETGILVHPVPRATFPARLAAAIVALADDPACARALGAAGAERVRAAFDWERKIDRILALYAEVLGRTATPGSPSSAPPA